MLLDADRVNLPSWILEADASGLVFGKTDGDDELEYGPELGSPRCAAPRWSALPHRSCPVAARTGHSQGPAGLPSNMASSRVRCFGTRCERRCPAELAALEANFETSQKYRKTAAPKSSAERRESSQGAAGIRVRRPVAEGGLKNRQNHVSCAFDDRGKALHLIHLSESTPEHPRTQPAIIVSAPPTFAIDTAPRHATQDVRTIADVAEQQSTAWIHSTYEESLGDYDHAFDNISILFTVSRQHDSRPRPRHSWLCCVLGRLVPLSSAHLPSCSSDGDQSFDWSLREPLADVVAAGRRPFESPFTIA
ncbi:hypothetical protein L1887_51913 [Cichorium endivia]|nr:hypothetical protein L1887_51913 [Cichorium endivia]